jgi:4-diphosphocytidyl-2-C-methyl-D-erythritol kinase
MTVQRVTLAAPAKLTLTLRVTGVRPDGMHLIDAEMVTLDLGDELVLTVGAGVEPTLRVRDAWSSAAVRGPEDARMTVEADGSNLVTRALAAVGRVASVDLLKRIPPGAGLGGGSADAAAVLRWAGVGDLALAAELGADVPFCVVGGRARVRGIGERVEPLPFVARTLTLLTPEIGCSTPAVYAAWDRLGGPVGEHGNDLEPAALAVEPLLAAARDRLGELTGQQPRLAGSGSTWFVEGAHDGPGLVVVRTTPAP